MANDQPIAASYSFDYGMKRLCYLSGLDPEYHSYSVGNLLYMYVVEDSIRKGQKLLDFARGAEPYKARWANQVRSNFEVRLARNGLFAAMHVLAKKSKPITKFMRKLGIALPIPP